MADNQQNLLDALVAKGLIKPADRQHVIERSKQVKASYEDVIASERLVFPEVLAQVGAEVLGVPYVDLSKVKISKDAMSDISQRAALTYRFYAFDVRGNKLLVGMETPDDFQALEAVKFIAQGRGLDAEVYLVSRESLDTVLGSAAAMKEEIGGALKEFSQELQEAKQVEGRDTKDIERIMEAAPVTKVVAVIIRHAIEGHASDIHVEPAEKEVRVRYRMDGRLSTSLILPLKVLPAIISRIKILSNLKIDESRLPQDGRFSATIDERSYDFRVSTMPTIHGEKAALRILDKSAGAPTFEQLGMSAHTRATFEERSKTPHGIILISGPTGSGKSTTLFTSLSSLNTPNVNIVTLEDPVEYEIEGVNQTQVHPDIGLTFASGLRNILRQDPDIIMVGEIRDRETAELAVHASLTGHLVLSTIHTNDAVGTVYRLVDMGIDPFLLAPSIRLLAAQRLVTRLCRECRREEAITPAALRIIQNELVDVPKELKKDENQKNPKVLYSNPGCPACHEGTSLGRMAIFETIPVSRAIRQAINDAEEYDTLKDMAKREGFISMRQDGILKALTGEVLFEDVMRVTAEAQGQKGG